MKVVGICGSLREGSLNMLALKNAQKLAPEGMEISVEPISDIPLYNDDVRKSGLPASVVQLRQKIAEADAVLLSSPEYNYSVSGVLKNTLDWVSRAPEPPMEEKPVAILGASIGMLGTARGQYHLRQILVYMNCFTLNKPEVFIGFAEKKFDESGELTDPAAVKLIIDQLVALKKLSERLAHR
ncbi:NAD(P)H-dependent oxidoreductase [Agrobacterium tumefaciens]|uniref:NADPH-dependent FMN reductase n=1 Tax=Agrobacterium tumefaciens TaxID=358 RepID=UPI0012B72935|nr:NADPH-dependent FMN reductase [Agrobacterium tumefaciens]MQB07256.1 NAD(P)H-dependent oxidoreductase [Agrobacterium tumefaciens]